MRAFKSLLLPATLALALGACGGGNDEVADPLGAVPQSASESPAGLTRYLGGLPALDAESREPVSLDGFNPPTSEDTEPEPVA